MLEDVTKELLQENDGLEVTYYAPGHKGTLTCQNIYEDDKKFILDNELVLTLEQLPTNEMAIYLRHKDQDEDEEVIELALGRTCQDTIKAAVETFKKENL